MSNIINRGKAADFECDDKIFYHFNGQKYKGIIADHFGTGVFVILEKSIHYPKPYDGAANPMGYNTDRYINEFELFDNEKNPWGEIGFLEKRNIKLEQK